MSQRALPLPFVMALTLAVVACTAGTTTTSSSGNGSPLGSGASATDPAQNNGRAELGAACKDYVACCAELAEKTPQLAMSCESTKTQIENAQANGAPTSRFEAACKSGVDALKSAGYCVPAVPPGPVEKCAPTCTSDGDCASSCPPLAGGVLCCDANTKTCFGSKTSACPKPQDAGSDPPPSY